MSTTLSLYISFFLCQTRKGRPYPFPLRLPTFISVALNRPPFPFPLLSAFPLPPPPLPMRLSPSFFLLRKWECSSFTPFFRRSRSFFPLSAARFRTFLYYLSFAKKAHCNLSVLPSFLTQKKKKKKFLRYLPPALPLTIAFAPPLFSGSDNINSLFPLYKHLPSSITPTLAFAML